jgi:hypothetical protein
LVLYNAVGEKSTTNTGAENEEEWILEKKRMSQMIQEELANKSQSIMARKQQLQPHIDDGEIAKYLGYRKRRTGTTSKTSSKKPRPTSLENLKRFINSRVAKDFPIGEEGDKITHDVFFGTVKYISDEEKLWTYVQYDDGDTEELNYNELMNALKYYDEQKSKDKTAILPKAGEDDDMEDSKLPADTPMNADKHESRMQDIAMSQAKSKEEADSSGNRRIGEYKEDIP